MHEGRELPTTPGAIIGYRKNGAPIRLQAGGDPTNDEPEGSDPKPAGKTFSEDEVNKLLERERTKLYDRMAKSDAKATQANDLLETMQDEVAELRKAEEARQKDAAKRQKEADEAARKAQEAELSAKELIERRQAEWQEQLTAQQSQWTEQLTGMQAQIAERDALLAKEREFAQLQAYAQAKVAEGKDAIAPELLDYIGGSTPEEIDASVEKAKATTASILAGIRQAQTAQRAAMPGVSAAGFAPVGPIDAAGGQRTLGPEEIKAMPMDEFAKLRGQLGMVQRGVGIFG